MVPAVWVPLESMPQNVNGKTDRLALEAMDVVVVADALETEAEVKMAEVWSQVLAVNMSEIGANSSFFALGGDSISALRLVAKAKQCGLYLTTALVMKHSTLRSMLNVSKAVDTAGTEKIQIVHGRFPLTPIQHFNFEHPWKNVNFWNLFMTLKPRLPLDPVQLELAMAQLVSHHDMLRARFAFRAEVGWSQEILQESYVGRPNVHFVDIDGFDSLEAAILEVEQSLHLTNGPVYAVTVFTTPDRDQYLQFTAHHAVVDLVSWRILVDDLETLLRGGSLGTKPLSFKAWSQLLSAKAEEWDPDLWNDYMYDDVVPPANSSRETVTASGTLDKELASSLNMANAKYGTNVQELALAALTMSLADLQGNEGKAFKFAVMLEGHGREAWTSDIDVSTTVGWFTCEYPVVFTSSSDLGGVLLQVKQKLRAVPDKGLSYSAIKYLAPQSKSTQKIKAHRHHNIVFNYLGRFQEMHADNGIFDPVTSISVPQCSAREDPLSPGALSLIHSGDELVMSATMEDWLFSFDKLKSWMDSWVMWMHRIVDPCLDSATLGGRTLSDVPLLGSTLVLKDVEAELLHTLDLRPADVDDIYPTTPLQSGLLYAMIQDPSEYVLQSAIDVRGDFDFARLKSCWTTLALQTDILRTVFVSTPHGIFRAVAKQDFSEWRLLDDVWSIDRLSELSEAYYVQDRQRGFSLSARSFQRFYGVRVSDGRLRVFWTHHHSVADGWSLPLLTNKFLSICYGESVGPYSVPFKSHIEWLLKQDTECSKLIWNEALKNLDKTAPLSLPKPITQADNTGVKYSNITKTIRLPQMKEVCRQLDTTPSTIFRTAWAIVLQEYTRCDYVKFGCVVSGRDTDVEG
ncbi:hypothetical protein AeNC1_017175 [Aphanomyces euteiches]|nr:hypothetical protein AeNC1_017175 [Aphanomyces euteiches]